MLQGKPFKNENPLYLIDEKTLKSNYSGIYYACVHKAQYITKGTLLGYTTDFWGNVLEEYHSPYTGIVKVIIVTPTINKGEAVCKVARVVDTF
jgi:hypothetical protein